MRVSLRVLAGAFCLAFVAPVFGQLQPPFRLKDINTVPARHDSTPGAFVRLGANMLFTATDAFHGTESAIPKAEHLNELRNRMK
jgi:hypothetical protein